MTTDMGSVSRAFPGVIFRVEITNVEDDARRVQYHRDGLFYEVAERREMPAFDPGRLAFEAPRDHGVLSLDTPIAQRGPLRDALQFLVEEAERDLVELHPELEQPAGSSVAMSVDELLDVLPALRRVAGKLILGRGTGRRKSQDGGSGSEATSIAHLIGREIREKHLPACSAFMHRYIETHEMQDLDGIMLAELERRKLERKAAGHAC